MLSTIVFLVSIDGWDFTFSSLIILFLIYLCSNFLKEDSVSLADSFFSSSYEIVLFLLIVPFFVIKFAVKLAVKSFPIFVRRLFGLGSKDIAKESP